MGQIQVNNSLSHERGSERSERASERASGPVRTSQFLAVLPHCGLRNASQPPKKLRVPTETVHDGEDVGFKTVHRS